MTHNVKAKIIKVDVLDRDGFGGAISASKRLQYIEAFDAEGLDLAYADWVLARVAEASESSTFVGLFATTAELFAVPAEDIPVGGYAFTGAPFERQIYYWDAGSLVWYNPFSIQSIKLNSFVYSGSETFTLSETPNGIISVTVLRGSASHPILDSQLSVDGADVTISGFGFLIGHEIEVKFYTTLLIGQAGPEGKSAFEVAQDAGFTGTLEEWLESLKGPAGTSFTILAEIADASELPIDPAPGDAYKTLDDEHILYFSGTDWLDLGVMQGPAGKSAYEIWLDNGNTGTEADFLEWLRGNPGKSAYDVWLDLGNTGTEADYQESLKGAPGAVDFATGDARYLRKDVDDSTAKTVSFGKLIITEPTLGGAFTHVLAMKDTGEVIALDPATVVGDKGRVMEVTDPSTVWVLNHGLNKYAGFMAKDSSGNPVYPKWQHTSLNQLVLSGFPSPASGTVILF